MFDDDEFAELAAYLAPVPGAVAVACNVIVDRGQGREQLRTDGAAVTGSERHLWVQRLELGEVRRDGVFSVLDDTLPVPLEIERLRVTGLPKLDHTGKLWSVNVVIED